LTNVAIHIKKFLALLFAAKNLSAKAEMVSSKSANVKLSENQRSRPNTPVEQISESKKDEQDKEIMAKKELEDFDSNIAALNHFAFLILFLVILGCDLSFWVLIGK
jgi:hypothetical protein